MSYPETLVCPDAPEPHPWHHVEVDQKPRLIFWRLGTQSLLSAGIRTTGPEKNAGKDQKRLLEKLGNATEGINIERAKAFIANQGLRIAPFRILNEADIRRAKIMGELEDSGDTYKASYDVALVSRHQKLEAVNGPEFTESILVHEFAHGTNEYHDVFYIEDIANNQRRILHGRSGQRVHDSRGEERGRLIEEARAEQLRGKYVKEILGRPFGFVEGALEDNYFQEGAAIVSAKYAFRHPNGTPCVMKESFAAQALDLLCLIDPRLDQDLTYARNSAEGLRNVAQRLERIQPGLYAYLRDTPYGRGDYKKRLIYVQQLFSSLLKTKSPIFR